MGSNVTDRPATPVARWIVLAASLAVPWLWASEASACGSTGRTAPCCTPRASCCGAKAEPTVERPRVEPCVCCPGRPAPADRAASGAVDDARPSMAVEKTRARVDRPSTRLLPRQSVAARVARAAIPLYLLLDRLLI